MNETIHKGSLTNIHSEFLQNVIFHNEKKKITSKVSGRCWLEYEYLLETQQDILGPRVKPAVLI